jgi:hypothetical protein
MNSLYFRSLTGSATEIPGVSSFQATGSATETPAVSSFRAQLCGHNFNFHSISEDFLIPNIEVIQIFLGKRAS